LHHPESITTLSASDSVLSSFLHYNDSRYSTYSN